MKHRVASWLGVRVPHLETQAKLEAKMEQVRSYMAHGKRPALPEEKCALLKLQAA